MFQEDFRTNLDRFGPLREALRTNGEAMVPKGSSCAV